MSPHLPSVRFLSDLSSLLRTPSLDLQALQGKWPEIDASLRKERRTVLARIPHDDPIRDTTDLLSPLNSDAGEVLHTLALAYLFSPLRSHGFRRAPLEQFLAAVLKMPEAKGLAASEIITALGSPRTKVVVIPERRHILANTRLRRIPRTDIWIEVQGRTATWVIVVENKIYSLEQDRQLDEYALHTIEWCKRHAHNSKPVLIFLTPDGRKPTADQKNRWIPVSYASLTGVLRRIWQRNKSARGASWLRLYIASLLHGVLGLTINGNRPLDLVTLRRYLGDQPT